MVKIREYLFAHNGNCLVYVHIDTDKETYIVKANQQITASSEQKVIDELKEFSFIKNVWTS